MKKEEEVREDMKTPHFHCLVGPREGRLAGPEIFHSAHHFLFFSPKLGLRKFLQPSEAPLTFTSTHFYFLQPNRALKLEQTYWIKEERKKKRVRLHLVNKKHPLMHESNPISTRK